MDISLHDKSRNVTIVPTKGPYVAALRGVAPDQDLFEIMRSLMKGANAEASEFRCDREFRTALDVQVMRDPDVIVGTGDGKGGDSFLGIPIIVEE